MVKSARGYILGVLVFFIQIFCISGYDKASMTFQVNKIQGMYKNYKEKLRSLDYLADARGDSTPIFGNSSSLNYYFVNVYLGNPPQKQSVIIDTGSHLTAVPCLPYCISCGKHMNPYYNSKLSSNSDVINCDSDKCKNIENSKCESDNTCAYSSVKKNFYIIKIIIF